MPVYSTFDPRKKKKPVRPTSAAAALPAINIPQNALQARASRPPAGVNTSFIMPPPSTAPTNADAIALSHGASLADIARSRQSPAPTTFLPADTNVAPAHVRAKNGPFALTMPRAGATPDVGPLTVNVVPAPLDAADPVASAAGQAVPNAAATAAGAVAGSATPVARPGTPIAGGGRIINGVPTFSDGSGGIAQTITPAQVAAKAAGTGPAPAGAGGVNYVPSTAFTNPLTNANAPGFADAVNPRPAPQPLVNPLQAQRFAASDMASVASGDWRSPLGMAANNLRVQSNSGTVRNRRIAERGLTQLTQNVAQQGNTAIAGAGSAANTAMTEAGANARNAASEAGANQRAALADASATQRAALTQPPIQLANGELVTVNRANGTGSVVRGADGQPLRAAQTKQSPEVQRAQKHIDGFFARTRALNDATLKLAPPGPDGKVAPLTAADIQRSWATAAQEQGGQLIMHNGVIAGVRIDGQDVRL